MIYIHISMYVYIYIVFQFRPTNEIYWRKLKEY